MSKFLTILEKCNCDKEECKAGVCKKCGLPIAKSATDFMGKGRNGKKCACDCKDKDDVKKESKFEQYIIETELIKEVDVIFEKFGSLDAMDADELGLPANTPLNFSTVEKAFKKFKGNADEFLKKLKSKLQGLTPEELDRIKMTISVPTDRKSVV